GKDIVKLLLEYGADPITLDSTGQTVLCLALWCGNADIVKLLFEYGADPNNLHSLGRAVLFTTAKIGDADVFELLFEHDARVDLVDHFQGTVLDEAMSK